MSKLSVRESIFSTFLVAMLCIVFTQNTNAQQLPPNKNSINDKVITDIRAFVDTEIVRLSVLNQNEKYGDMTADEINALDQQWRGERKQDQKPLISSTLTNPLSAYLTRVQALSIGLYSEIFVMDANGLNVGQSNISSDYWQGDEAKFQKTYPLGARSVFIDDPEYDDEKGIWNVQVNLTVSDQTGSKAIGAITVQINLSELERRQKLGLI